MDERLTLLALNRLVKDAIEAELPDEYWVEAELSECRESRGHCYLELIQKDERTATPVAKASARCWASKWMLIRPYFERTTGERLRPGMKVLLRVYPQFHEAFGFAWIVTDIDPSYTLGDMARKRMEIIHQLKEQGVFDLQKEQELPLFCQRIAVISSEAAAGYGDFCRQLAENPQGFQFTTRLFPAIMQGEGTEGSIIAALNRINEAYEDFDAVVIIRGGGATSDLSGFDTLALAENVANFPLPVITGIGHDRDECVLDMVSHTRVKTPTAAADLLISRLKAVLDAVEDAQERIARATQQRLYTLGTRLTAVAEAIPRLFSVVKVRQEARIDALYNRLATAALRQISERKHRVEIIGERVKALDPTLPLKRGYSITLKDGRAVRDPSALQKGDEIETLLEKGRVKSVVK